MTWIDCIVGAVTVAVGLLVAQLAVFALRCCRASLRGVDREITERAYRAGHADGWSQRGIWESEGLGSSLPDSGGTSAQVAGSVNHVLMTKPENRVDWPPRQSMS